MKASDIIAAFESIAPIESGIEDDIEHGFLGLRVGSPEMEVTGLGVAWWLAEEVIDAAIEQELNFLLLHEPELYRSWESPWHSYVEPMDMPYNRRKAQKLADHNICVYTAHSNWDLQLEVGMGPTIAKLLGFKDPVKCDKAVLVFDVDPMPFSALIEHVKTRMGLPQVRVQGDPDLEVKRVVLGWGAMGAEMDAIIANGADAGIWGELRDWPFLFAREAGVGIIETTHVISESIGFRSVADEIAALLPGLRIAFLDIVHPWRVA